MIAASISLVDGAPLVSAYDPAIMHALRAPGDLERAAACGQV